MPAWWSMSYKTSATKKTKVAQKGTEAEDGEEERKGRREEGAGLWEWLRGRKRKTGGEGSRCSSMSCGRWCCWRKGSPAESGLLGPAGQPAPRGSAGRTWATWAVGSQHPSHETAQSSLSLSATLASQPGLQPVLRGLPGSEPSSVQRQLIDLMPSFTAKQGAMGEARRRLSTRKTGRLAAPGGSRWLQRYRQSLQTSLRK